jgi:hypothetical protein
MIAFTSVPREGRAAQLFYATSVLLLLLLCCSAVLLLFCYCSAIVLLLLCSAVVSRVQKGLFRSGPVQ